MIYTVKGFGIINKAEVDVFLVFFCFFYDPAAAAAAKSLQLCPTLCDPIDSSPLLLLKVQVSRSVVSESGQTCTLQAVPVGGDMHICSN